MAILSSTTVIFEPTSRITEYNIFSLPKAMEGIVHLLEAKGLITRVSNFVGIAFALSMATMVVMRKKYPKQIPPSFKAFLDLIFAY